MAIQGYQATAPNLEGDDRGYMSFADSPDDEHWLQQARAAYESSTTWFDSSVRKEIEDSYAAFYNRHRAGSKYWTEDYVKRSKIFRPKTRIAIRNNEAAAAIAAFATSDVVHCAAPNRSDPQQRMSAKLHKNLINYRLKNSIKWFSIFIAGVQDAQTTGVVCSKQTWDFREKKIVNKVTRTDVRTGESYSSNEIEYKVFQDKPAIELIPVELLRVDPACDWSDPIGTSPYIIHMMPMYVHKVKQRMTDAGPKALGPKFRKVSDGLLHAAISQDWDSVRRAREEGRIDRYDNETHLQDFHIIWVHEVIVEMDDGDWIYYTLGNEAMLSDAVPLEEIYPHGRPFSFGSAVIEAHKTYPSSVPQLIDGLQEIANDVANLRLDNVRLAMNGRYFAARGRGVDIRTLRRQVPGSTVMMRDPSKDVKWDRPADVTRSSYEEQDRLNLDMDDMTGTTSQASVSSNRKLNQTVGGMEMIGNNANMIQEFLLRTIIETWAEPALKQLVRLEAIFETDENVLQIAADETGTDIITAFRLLPMQVDLSVNIGFGATNPVKRVERFSLAMRSVAEFAPDLVMESDRKEIAQEIFGAVGFDAGRFFPALRSQEQQDPRIQQLEKQVQEMSQVIEMKQLERATRVEVAQIGAESKREGYQMDWQKFQLKHDLDMKLAALKASLDQELNRVETALKIEHSDVQRRQLLLQREALNKAILDGEREYQITLYQLGLEEPPTLNRPPPVKQLTGAIGEGAVDLAGSDRAGTISRDRYGDVPFAGQ